MGWIFSSFQMFIVPTKAENRVIFLRTKNTILHWYGVHLYNAFKHINYSVYCVYNVYRLH